MIFLSGLGSSDIIQNLLQEAVDDSLNFYNLPLVCKSNCQLSEDTYNGIIQRSILYAKLKGKTAITTVAPQSLMPVSSDIVYIGNPGKNQYPGNDNKSNLARCIWDMQYHQNRIYMSYGDSWNNQGPVYVWSIANNETAFKKETILTE